MATNEALPPRIEVVLLATTEPRRGLFGLFPPASRAELWAGLVLIALSLLGSRWGLKCRSDALALERDAVTVEGKIVRL